MGLITMAVGRYKKTKETEWGPEFEHYSAGVLSFIKGNKYNFYIYYIFITMTLILLLAL